MKMKTIYRSVLAGVAVAMIGCGSAPVQKVEVEAPQFKVLDAAKGGREAWLDNPNFYAEKEGLNTKDFYFYTGEAQSANKRMACEKAQADTVDDISKQVSVFVDSAISRAQSDSTSDDTAGLTSASASSSETSKISSQLSKTVVGGIQKKKQYWEQRDYSQVGGAKSIYTCWVLVQVAKRDVEQMVLRARTLRFKDEPDLKNKVETKLNTIEKDFDSYIRAQK
jgi:hypothetical protein